MQKTFVIPQASIVRAFVTGYSSRQTVAKAAADFHATIQPGHRSLVVNGDGFPPYAFQSNGIWVTDGKWRNSEFMEWRPYLGFDKNHIMFLGFREKPYAWPASHTTWNAFTLTRRLVTNGAINPAFVEPNELNSRAGFGLTANSELVISCIDGWDEHHEGLEPCGWKLTQLGQDLIQHGVVEGGDGDAGGSFTLAIDGVVVNDWYNDGLSMRPVVNHFCLELTELPDVTPPPEPPDPEPEPGVEVVDIVVNYSDGTSETFVRVDEN